MATQPLSVSPNQTFLSLFELVVNTQGPPLRGSSCSIWDAYTGFAIFITTTAISFITQPCFILCDTLQHTLSVCNGGLLRCCMALGRPGCVCVRATGQVKDSFSV